ncbi:MAG: transposase zinc-binding domain-containing protein [Candidatus Thiodiazotropha lotti]|nr:transposase zinc-binding domain-containing protein [Candidatus Thiodiazotropha lotti]MCW4218775.1 transposase zinc-binding domain-containing protein [Candidatus Thiodiazotropha lotti]
MALQSIVHRYRERFVAQFGHTLIADQWSALNVIGACRQGPYGGLLLSCHHCHHQAEVVLVRSPRLQSVPISQC